MRRRLHCIWQRLHGSPGCETRCQHGSGSRRLLVHGRVAVAPGAEVIRRPCASRNDGAVVASSRTAAPTSTGPVRFEPREVRRGQTIRVACRLWGTDVVTANVFTIASRRNTSDWFAPRCRLGARCHSVRRRRPGGHEHRRRIRAALAYEINTRRDSSATRRSCQWWRSLDAARTIKRGQSVVVRHHSAEFSGTNTARS